MIYHKSIALHQFNRGVVQSCRFIHSTRGQVGRKELAFVLLKVAGYTISPSALDLVFEIFSIEGNHLDVSAFLDALKQHRKTHALAEVCRTLVWLNLHYVCRVISPISAAYRTRPEMD